jgi:superfamily II DNA or RNA helicase
MKKKRKIKRESSFKSFNETRKFARMLGISSCKEWVGFCKNQNKPQDIPSNPNKMFKDKGWKGWPDFLGKRKTEYRTYEGTKKFARSLNLKSKKEWSELCKSGKKPKDIPSNLYQFYKDKGWTSWPEFFDNGNIETFKIKFRPFIESKNFVRSLNLKSKKEWIKYCASGKKPKDIPFNPDKTYKNKGWIDWSDFLGKSLTHFRSLEDTKKFIRALGISKSSEWKKFLKSGNRPKDIPFNPDKTYKNKGWKGWNDLLGKNFKKYRSLEETQKFVQELGINSCSEWREFVKSGNRPKDIPSNLYQFYKDKGWKSWEDLLNNRSIEYRSFEETQKFIQQLGISSSSEWKRFLKSGNKPKDIPSYPNHFYKDNGWKSWLDFFSNFLIKYKPYEETKEFVRELGISSYNQWIKYTKSGNKPHDIPRNPDKTYKGKGWIDWYEFFGKNKEKFRSFEETRKFVNSLKIKSITEWKKYCKSGLKPEDIPNRPSKTYKNQGWIDWYDFFGKNKEKFRSFQESKEFVKTYKLTSYKEWTELHKSGKVPKDIPFTPNEVYKNKGWRGFPDFLGYLGNGNVWSKSNLATYLEIFRDSLHVCSTPVLFAIITSNGLDKYIKDVDIKKLQNTIPGSPERYTIINTIIKEITEEKTEDLEIVNEDGAITDQFINDVLTNDKFLEEENEENIIELRKKQLESLDTQELTHSLDTKRVEFIINDFVNTLWSDTINEKPITDIFSEFTLKNEIPTTIKEIFLEEYENVKNLKLPKNWIYPNEPLLMQKLIAYRLKQKKRYGNWSGVGSGKTISGILAGEHVGAKNTLVITFNSTIGHEDQRGWTKEIKSAVKNANIYTKIDKDIKFTKNSKNYLILNYETFQQIDSIEYVVNLLERNKFDYIILDEVQSIKQTKLTEVSKRREVIMGLIRKVKENNPDYYLLAMSATPVINNLVEAVSLFEIIEMRDLPEINTIPTIHNCLEVFQRLTNYGLRYKNIGDNILKDNKFKVIEIEANDLYSKAKRIKRNSFLEIDKLLLETKLEAIVPYINASKGKTVIYSYYVDGIDDYIYNYLTDLGFKVGVYTGSQNKQSREEVLDEFIHGDYDVLLGSKPIGTGVDGLQKVADTIIIISLPWTNAEFVQIIGRINRKGSAFVESGIDVIIPLVSINGFGRRFRWDYHRFNTITYKKTIANAAVDGIIPDKILPSKEMFIEEASSALPEWIERLNKEELTCVE